MTREQIEKAAKETLVNEPIELQATKVGAFQRGFVAGAQWRINSVWHDINEEPKEHKLVLIEDDFCGEPDYGVWRTPFPNWKDDIVHFSSKRWAYIDDLLPERKEKTE